MRRLAAASLVLACSSTLVTTPEGAVHQLSWDAFAETHVPALVVIVVDDSPDADGQSARVAMTPEAIAPSFDGVLQRFRDSTSSSDPAGRVRDVRAIVVHPSSGAFVSPLDDPALAITKASVGPADVNVVASAVAAHAQEAVASAGAPYPLLAATRDVVSLATRERAPRDLREAALVASLPPAWTTVSVAMVTGHDDASANTPDSYAPPASVGGPFATYQVIERCTGADPAPALPRLRSWWNASLGSSAFVDILTDGCAYPNPSGLPLTEFGTDDIGCLAPYPPPTVARDASGGAECVVTFDSAAVTSCDPARGWADPRALDGTRRPFLVDYEGQSARRCEILQLDGAARTSCETTLSCDGCAPGVCFTTSEPDDDWCRFARFVGDSLPTNAVLHFTCNLDP